MLLYHIVADALETLSLVEEDRQQWKFTAMRWD